LFVGDRHLDEFLSRWNPPHDESSRSTGSPPRRAMTEFMLMIGELMDSNASSDYFRFLPRERIAQPGRADSEPPRLQGLPPHAGEPPRTRRWDRAAAARAGYGDDVARAGGMARRPSDRAYPTTLQAGRRSPASGDHDAMCRR